MPTLQSAPVAYVVCLHDAYTMPWLPTLCVLVAYVVFWCLCLHDALVAYVVCLRVALVAYVMPTMPDALAAHDAYLTRCLGCLRCRYMMMPWLPKMPKMPTMPT